MDTSILYEKNLEAIKRYDKNLYENYLKYKKESIEEDSNIKVQSKQAENGTEYWIIEKEDKDYRMNSSYNPDIESEIWAEQFSMANLEMVVMLFGLGDGRFYHKLKERAREETKIVIFEPSISLFDYQMHHIDMDSIVNALNTVLIVEGLNKKSLYDVLSVVLTIYNFEFSIEISLPRYDVIFQEAYQAYSKFIDNMIRSLGGEYFTYISYSSLLSENSLFALRYLKKGQLITQYKNVFPKNAAAIIVAAGPSLDYNIDQLRKAKGKSIIIATDTAMPQMIAHEIEPDFIITVDVVKSLTHLENEKCNFIPYICTDVSRRELLEKHKSQKIFCQLSEYLEIIYEDLGKDVSFLGSGTSVATLAFSACVMMGIKNIIMIGQDLAYRDGASHAGKSLRREEENKDHIEVEGIYGDMVETREEWYRFLLWFEDATEDISNDSVVIDATEGGAKIRGSLIMTLEEAIQKYCTCEVNCKKIVNEMPTAFDQEEWILFKERIHHFFEEIEDIYQYCKKGEYLSEELMECARTKKFGLAYEKKVIKIGDINKKMMEMSVYSLIDIYMFSLEEEKERKRMSVNEMQDDSDKDELETYKIANSFYKDLKKACNQFKPILEKYYQEMIDTETI